MGHGHLQRQLLALLAEHAPSARSGESLDTLELARLIHGREPTHSELVSIRRALAALLREGAVRRLHGRHGHRHQWWLQW